MAKALKQDAIAVANFIVWKKFTHIVLADTSGLHQIDSVPAKAGRNLEDSILEWVAAHLVPRNVKCCPPIDMVYFLRDKQLRDVSLHRRKLPNYFFHIPTSGDLVDWEEIFMSARESIVSVAGAHEQPFYCELDHINSCGLVLKPKFGAAGVGILHLKLDSESRQLPAHYV